MRKKSFIILAVLIVLTVINLAGCGKTEEIPAWNYFLDTVLIDDNELPAERVYSRGAWLTLSGDGTGVMVLDSTEENFADITWIGQEDSFRLKLNTLEATGYVDNYTANIIFDELGMELRFVSSSSARNGNAVNVDESENYYVPEWSGEWNGRLWFEETAGEWSEYEKSTLAARAFVSFADETHGSISIYNDFYSGLVPMAVYNIELGYDTAEFIDGYMMGYEYASGAADVSVDYERRGDIESTVIMHPDVWEYGHYYISDPDNPPPDENEMLPVMRINGACSDLAGRFTYKIVLTR